MNWAKCPRLSAVAFYTGMRATPQLDGRGVHPTEESPPADRMSKSAGVFYRCLNISIQRAVGKAFG